MMKSLIGVGGWVVVMLFVVAAAGAQELEFPISPNPVGSGARAAGMANAFVAVADDATAASWNPAGLVQLERPELSIVGSFNSIKEYFHADDAYIGFESTQEDQNFDLNFMSFVYPLPWTIGGRNITLSLSFQQKYDLSRHHDLDFIALETLPSGSIATTDAVAEFRQDGALGVITPALAVEITDRLSVGVSFNLWRETPFSDSGWTQDYDESIENFLNGTSVEIFTRSIRQKYKDLTGENFSIGALWSVTDRLSFGVRYDTRLLADVKFSQRTEIDGAVTSDFDEDRTLSIPPTFAIGAAYRFSDRFTASMDITTADWDDFYIESEDGTKISLVDAQDVDDPNDSTEFDRTVTVRLGAEYVLLPKTLTEKLSHLWTFRGGLYYDQEPASGRSPRNSQTPGHGTPDDFYGLTVGAGVQLFQRVNLDFAYELRYGNNVNSDFIRNVGFSEDVLQHRALLSAVVYF